MTTSISMTMMTEDAYGFPKTFECTNVTLNITDVVTPVTLDFFYDMAFVNNSPDDLNATSDLARAFVEGSLLQQVAAYYGFWNGQACQGPLDGKVWFIKISSLQPDVPNPNVNASTCFELVPEENEECISFQAQMTGDIVGIDDTLDTISLIAQQMNSDAVTATTESIRVKFLGTSLDYGFNAGRDNLRPALNTVKTTFTDSSRHNSFTLVGIAIVAGMALTVVGLAIVIVRRRRQRPSFSHQEFQDEDVKSEVDTGSETRLEEGESPAPGRDENGNVVDDDTLPESPDEFSREYNFDLGGWMKSELIGIHGGSAITAQPSNGGAPPSLEEGLSDSDNDSWAQTDATIGSLELRLDPIEAEV